MRQAITIFAAILLLSSVSAEAQFFEGPFTWSQGEQIKFLKSGNDFVCVLTRVTGHFQGGGEQVLLSLEQSGVANAAGEASTWILGGSSLQKGVSAAAYCFRKDKFLSSGTARWNSERFATNAKSGASCVTSSTEAWWGDAATYLSGMTGNFAGGGESIRIDQSSAGFTPSLLVAKSCQPFLGGYAQAFFSGTPHTGTVAQFWGPSGKGAASVAGEYTVSATSLNPSKVSSIRMAPVSEAMCYFTRIGGKFRGGGEYVEIVPETNRQGLTVWVLRAQSLQSDGVSAGARCYRRIQQ